MTKNIEEMAKSLGVNPKHLAEGLKKNEKGVTEGIKKAYAYKFKKGGD